MTNYKKLGYPLWKRVAWRGLRTFMSAFLIAGSMVLVSAKESAFECWQNFLTTLLYPFILAGLTAGVNAFGKYLREVFGSAKQDSKIDKIII